MARKTLKNLIDFISKSKWTAGEACFQSDDSVVYKQTAGGFSSRMFIEEPVESGILSLRLSICPDDCTNISSTIWPVDLHNLDIKLMKTCLADVSVYAGLFLAYQTKVFNKAVDLAVRQNPWMDGFGFCPVVQPILNADDMYDELTRGYCDNFYHLMCCAGEIEGVGLVEAEFTIPLTKDTKLLREDRDINIHKISIEWSESTKSAKSILMRAIRKGSLKARLDNL